MAIKKISEFTAGTPTDDDYILFEQNGAGKSAKFGDFSLTFEEIMASTDLSGKVASASALKKLNYQEYSPSINGEYGSGIVFASRIGDIPRFIIYINVTKNIGPWVDFVNNLPPFSISGLSEIDISDTGSQLKLRYRAGGILSSRDYINKGTYYIVF